jgi:hypothetical protein
LISASTLCPTTSIPLRQASFVSYPSPLSAIIPPFLAYRWNLNSPALSL